MCLCICSCFSRCILYLCNTLMILFGLNLLVIGCFFKLSRSYARNFLFNAANSTEFTKDVESLDQLTSSVSDILQQVSSATIAAGVIIMLISIIGFCGACKRNRCYLYMYVLCIGIAAGIAGGLCIFSALGKSKFKHMGEQRAYQMFAHYKNESIQSKAFSLMMTYFKCCGVSNGTDFRLKNNNWRLTHTKDKVPKVCCRNRQEPNCTKNPTSKNSYTYIGCFSKLWALFMKHSMKITIVLATSTVVLLSIIVLTCCVVKYENYKAKKTEEKEEPQQEEPPPQEQQQQQENS